MSNNKWFMTSIKQTLTATGYIIVITTDIACHLWMRWTVIPPQEHLIQRTKRGLPLMLEKYFCFDVYEDNEQEEAGDTLLHTFIKEPWPECETRYFYFQGEIAGVASPSTTAIFKKHRVEPTLIIDHDPPWTGIYGIFTDARYGNTFQPTYDFKLTKIEVRYRRCFNGPCPNGILSIYDTPTVGDDLPTLLATSTITMPALPAESPGIWVPFPFDQLPVVKDHRYLFLSKGCSPYYTTPFHCTTYGTEPGACSGCCKWTWLGWRPPPRLTLDLSYSIHHKIWGIPT